MDANCVLVDAATRVPISARHEFVGRGRRGLRSLRDRSFR
jgi:hypothetical protein